MNNINILKIFLPIFILGCSQNVVEENRVIQKINSLNMNVFSKTGEKIYSITSPDSKFDKIKLVFNLKRTTINIFKGEDIKYTIDSESSRLLDKNKIVELKGNVKLRSLNQNNDYLFGDNLIWNINESKYELFGNVRLQKGESFLFGDYAEVDLKKGISKLMPAPTKNQKKEERVKALINKEGLKTNE